MASRWAKFKRAAFVNLAVYLIYALIWIIFLTCKKTYRGARLDERPCVVLFWHGRIAMMSFAYRKFWTRDFSGKRHGKVIISDHKDGEIITRVIKFFGIGTIRGSSSKGGAKALIEALREIKSGTDVIITPDGPRGPRHSVADGAAIIAQKQNANIQILNYEASSFWQLKSWDKMIIPKPFCTINFSLSEPFSVLNLSPQEAKESLQNKLWSASEHDGGASVEKNREEFVQNLKIWWEKNQDKELQNADEFRNLLNENGQILSGSGDKTICQNDQILDPKKETNDAKHS